MTGFFASHKLKDGVYPVSFQGSAAWAIIWHGEELQMYWGSEVEAKQHLWLLTHPDAAEFMVNTHGEDATVPFYNRFEHLRTRWYYIRKRSTQAPGTAIDVGNTDQPYGGLRGP